MSDCDDLDPFVDHAIDDREGKSPDDVAPSASESGPSLWSCDDRGDCVVHGEDESRTEATPPPLVPASRQAQVQRRLGVNAVWLLRVGHGGQQGSRLGPLPSREGQLGQRRHRRSVVRSRRPTPARFPLRQSRHASSRLVCRRASPDLSQEAQAQLLGFPVTAACSKCSAPRTGGSIILQGWFLLPGSLRGYFCAQLSWQRFREPTHDPPSPSRARS
jgi:hypothetical protein